MTLRKGGNRLQFIDPYKKDTKIESGPAFCPTLSFKEFYNRKYINTVNLLVQNSDAQNIITLFNIYYSNYFDLEKIKSDNKKVQEILNSYPDVVNNIINEQQKFSKCYDSKKRMIIDPSEEEMYSYSRQRSELIYSAITRLIITAYSEPLKYFEEQMEIFYDYLTGWRQKEHIPPFFEEGSSTGTNSATHTEFMMVYYIIKNDTDILEKFNNFTNMFTNGATVTPEERKAAFHELINNLGPKLPNRIYSAHCMCPVCEAFLTSLYNVCASTGEFISIRLKYESSSGPSGKLKKIRLGEDEHIHHQRLGGGIVPNTVANGKGAAGSSTGPSFGAPPSTETVRGHGLNGTGKTGVHDKKSNNSKAQRYNKPNSLGSSRSRSRSHSRRHHHHDRLYSSSSSRSSSRNRSRRHHHHDRLYSSSSSRSSSRNRSRSHHHHHHHHHHHKH